MSPEKMSFTPQGTPGYLADMAMAPVMYLLQGNFKEVPQRTHVWNNKKFIGAQYVNAVTKDYTVYDPGNPKEKSRGLVRFHIPFIGGWKKFLVVSPAHDWRSPWHIGWHNWDSGGYFAGVSLVPVNGCVRILQGDKPIRFFGIMPQGEQVPVCIRGFGYIGQALEYARLPLL